MATNDVPGANPQNADVLKVGAWAEHADGSLVFVKGTEGDQVVYEMFDLAQEPPVSYSDAIRAQAFKSQFSVPPIGTSKERWVWHDKTPFPWDRVMKDLGRPVPKPVFAEQSVSAAQRVADSLNLRARTLNADELRHNAPSAYDAVLTIASRIGEALRGLGG